MVESKESLTDIHTGVPSKTNHGTDTSEESCADTVDVPQCNQDATMSASSAMVIDESDPLAEQRMIRTTCHLCQDATLKQSIKSACCFIIKRRSM